MHISKKKLLYYLGEKLAGAGFTMAMLALVVLFSTNFDLYELQGSAKQPFFWFVIYGYGNLVSCLIDFLAVRITKIGALGKTVLYAISGYLFFVLYFLVLTVFRFNEVKVDESLFFILFAGTIGAGCALVYYLGLVLLKKSKVIRTVIGIGVPIVLLMLIVSDVSTKDGWEYRQGPSTFSAKFDEFNGEHKIPVSLDKGESIDISIKWKIDQGGYGYHIEDAKGRLQPMEELGKEGIKFHALENEVYYITLVGHRAKGSVNVKWMHQ